MARLSNGWWRHSEHYDWLSGYLHARGMSNSARIMMSGIVGSFSLSLVALLLSSDGPHGAVPVAVTWIAVGGGIAGTVLWAWRWPNHPQSLVFGLVTNTSIALACLAHSNPLASLIGCIAFATSGAYFAFFHSTRLVLYNFAVAATVGLIEAISLAQTGHLALAAVDLWLVLQVNIALPLAIRALVNALSVDLLHSDRDPLTGLLNRRAFQFKTLGLLVARENGDRYLTVALVDLDDFKALNDAHGHLAGDRALVRVARALRANTDKAAVIARSGGEEFLIALLAPTCDQKHLAQRICDAIAASPAQVTASVGTACAAVDNNGDESHQSLIERLTADADTAMYRAKRNGGNRVQHHGAEDSVN